MNMDELYSHTPTLLQQLVPSGGYRLLYYFDQLDTTLWLWLIGSVRHLDAEASDLWQCQFLDTQEAKNR